MFQPRTALSTPAETSMPPEQDLTKNGRTVNLHPGKPIKYFQKILIVINYRPALLELIDQTRPLGSVQSTFVMKEAKTETAFPIEERKRK